MGDEHDGCPARFPQPQQVVVERHPGDLVECRERFVEQQQIGIGDQGAGNRNPHPHAAGELARISTLKPGEPDGADFRRDALALSGPGPPGDPKGQ